MSTLMRHRFGINQNSFTAEKQSIAALCPVGVAVSTPSVTVSKCLFVVQKNSCMSGFKSLKRSELL